MEIRIRLGMGVGHYARNCTVRPRRRDAAYLQTQLLIPQKEEAGIQLQAEDTGKQIMTLNKQISDLNKQLSKKKSTVSFLLEEKKKLKSDFKTHEDELLDKQIQFEKKIKELNNILLKTGQLIQTIHMLSPKRDSFYHTEQKMALGYQNPFYLKQAQKKQQSLYDGNVLLEKHDPSVVHDSEETLQLAQESREKMKQLNKELKPTKYTKINHLSRGFVPQTTLSRKELYFSNNSKRANVSKSISISNEDFSDDTTLSVARKFLNEVKSTIVTLQRVVKQRMTIKTHNWSSSAHQELHKNVRDENFPIVNQVDARLQNFKIQFLKEAAKFVEDFKSLANEADASLAKHKTLELKIERLLKAVVSQDIMNIVQNESVVDTFDLQLSLNVQKNALKTVSLKRKLNMLNFGMIGIKNVFDQKDNTQDTSENTKFAKQPIVENLPKVGETNALSKPVTTNSVSTPQESKGVDNTKTRRPQPRSNTKNDRVLSASKSSRSQNKEAEVEEHHRNLLLSKNNKHLSPACNNIKLDSQDVISNIVCVMCKKCLISVNYDKCLYNYVNGKNSCGNKQKAKVSLKENQMKYQPKVSKPKKVIQICLWCVDSGCSKHMTRNLKLLINFVWKFMGIVRFGNDHVAAIMGFGDLRITVLLQSPVIIIRTDNGTEFKNQVLKEYFDTVGISHQMSSVRTPQQNGVVERRNQTLVEAARTMLIFSCAPLFLCAEAIATACFTQNHSIIHPMAFEQRSSKPRLNSMTSRQISSGLDLTYAPSTITTQQPSEGKLDLLFEAMYDDYISGQPSATGRIVSPAQEPQVCQTSTASTTITDTAPTLTNSSSLATNIPITSKDVDELNSNAMVDGNTFVNPFANSSTSAAASSSSQNVDPSNMYTFYQPDPHEFQWTKDHPLEQVIGEPSRPVLTKNQLRSDGDMCVYALMVSTIEPKNVKEAMTDPAWIESMQKELLQFKRMDVWVLVPAPDNISHLTLKWIFKNKHDEEQTSKYVLEILNKYGIESCDPVGTPMEIKDKIDLDQNGTPVDATKYRSMIGALMYLTSSRPDVVHATCLCARYHSKPTEKHLKEVKRIFRYLQGTVNTGIWYMTDSGLELTRFSDADYAGCKDTFKSTSGGAQFLGEKLVSWSSKKQDCTVLSTAKAEYVSLSACCAQVLWMRTQLTDYGFHFKKIPIYCDSKSAIAISCNPVQHSRTKHIAVRYHFIKEHVEKARAGGIYLGTLPLDRVEVLGSSHEVSVSTEGVKELKRIAKPTEKYLKEVKRIFRYLRGTVNTGIWYMTDSGFELTEFSDADYAGCKDTFKSTPGGAQFLAIAISCNPVQHSRTKHIAVRYHFIKEHVEKGTIELYFVKTDYQLADIFTKALPTDRFNYLVRRLGMRSLSSKELERLAKS
nr:uncharacterized mitochondrial protein AtMg00810-like [Tanacetum cinerariifolium]